MTTTAHRKRSVITRDDLMLTRDELARLTHILRVGVETMHISAKTMVDAAATGQMPDSVASEFVRYHSEGSTLLEKLERGEMSGLGVALFAHDAADFEDYDEAFEDFA